MLLNGVSPREARKIEPIKKKAHRYLPSSPLFVDRFRLRVSFSWQRAAPRYIPSTSRDYPIRLILSRYILVRNGDKSYPPPLLPSLSPVDLILLWTASRPVVQPNPYKDKEKRDQELSLSASRFWPANVKSSLRKVTGRGRDWGKNPRKLQSGRYGMDGWW